VDTSDDKSLNFEEFGDFCLKIGMTDKEAVLLLFQGMDSD